MICNMLTRFGVSIAVRYMLLGDRDGGHAVVSVCSPSFLTPSFLLFISGLCPVIRILTEVNFVISNFIRTLYPPPVHIVLLFFSCNFTAWRSGSSPLEHSSSVLNHYTLLCSFRCILPQVWLFNLCFCLHFLFSSYHFARCISGLPHAARQSRVRLQFYFECVHMCGCIICALVRICPQHALCCYVRRQWAVRYYVSHTRHIIGCHCEVFVFVRRTMNNPSIKPISDIDSMSRKNPGLSSPRLMV